MPTRTRLIMPLVLGLVFNGSCESHEPEVVPDTSSASEPQGELAERSQAIAQASVSVVVSVPSSMRSAPFDVERRLTVPPGFSAAVFARVPSARFMTVAPDGRVLVSVPSAGKIVALSTSGAASDLLTGLLRPHDMVFHTIASTTYLYVSEKNRVRRYTWTSGVPTNSQIVVANLPDASLAELGGAYGHELKNIALDAQNRLFVSIASASNADPADMAATPKRGAIYVYNADGSAGRLFAQGIRNAEGLAIAPGTSDLWIVVNNRDNIAYPFHQDWDGNGTDDYGKVMQSYVDNHPPEEFIRVRDGGNYGWPFCNPNPDSGLVNMPFDRDVQNNADGTRLDCVNADRVNRGIQAHSAALGLSFVVSSSGLPSDYVGSAVSAYHGCWNCSVPVGYKVAIFPFVSGLPTQEIDLFSGFRGFSRPVDVVVNGAGQIFVSDDTGGAIFRFTYTPPASQSVSKLVLLNASTQQPVPGYDPFPNNANLDLATLGAGPFAIRAYTSPTTVGSVRFALDGATLLTDSTSPYCIAGDDGTRCNAWTLPVGGSHSLQVTPYTAAGGAGQAGTALTRTFTVSNGGTRVCASQPEGASAALSCPTGTLVRSVQFASYGTPSGSCGAFTASSCNATTSRSVVETACLNRASCGVPATNATFGDPCRGTHKRLNIQANCAP